MKTEIRILFVILFALFLVNALVEYRNQTPPVEPGTQYEIVKRTVHDTIYMPVHSPAEVIHVPVPADVDTAAIISNFFTKNIYADTVQLGDYIEFVLTDTVSCNSLISHKFDVLSLPDVYIPPGAVSSRCVALGAMTGRNLLALKCDLTIRRNQYSLGYDFINRSPIIGYSYRIASWK